jgi:5'-3' exonuclease
MSDILAISDGDLRILGPIFSGNPQENLDSLPGHWGGARRTLCGVGGEMTEADQDRGGRRGVDVHLVDGTYELFRHFYGGQLRTGSDGAEVGATRGVVTSVLGMIEDGASHLGVATDHVIESFRNDLWPTYKRGDGVDPLLMGQFTPLEEALDALGVLVWPMVELEADDALASAAAVAAADASVGRVVICTPDKDLAQCVVDGRVVQLDRRSGTILDEAGVHAKFGVAPASIPDWLALVGDSADGFPGLPGWGKRTASVVLDHYGHLEAVPDDPEAWDPGVRAAVRGASRVAGVLAAERQTAELFRLLATLRVEPDLLADVEALRWRGPTPAFAGVCERLRDPGLEARAQRAAER